MTSDAQVREAGWLESTAGVRALEDRVLVSVRGDDARTWLNGQITNDVRTTRAGDAVYALAIHVKGRVLADLFVLDRGERGLAMTLPRRNLAALLEHFERYVIMEDVELVTDESVALVTVQGPRAKDVETDGLETYACDRLGRGGVDVLAPSAQRDEVLAALTQRAAAIGGGAISEEGWELARLRAARPALFADFGEHTYPQEAGLEQGAVSFQKGCYLGQEVVCMLENRGQLNRRLVALESDAELAPGVGITDASGAKLGEITSAVRDPERARTLALGFVKRAHASAGTELTSDKGALRVTAVVASA
ncbi:YgfZ/GcvT domain-containing protein [Sandaracinus amylolyticus]|uniref:Folate-dependent protein for Fe/S cluster synthesis/repair in oxidative stress n=1 Tax=Sandaracinus amylolyticus TaxID=927083 RepID=A0A0F6YGZ4_9BACT|nr:glycine cleavage T C-terminal barrel domain-containing protein [Sandaracinus amylolyticus]AKF05251.1 Folate-dependent protein for Fe/S cluster synthesis/repair in oxidative stress [Sandaracinus amylolyticus]